MFVSVLMVQILLDECRSRGVEPERMLAGTGLTTAQLSHSHERFRAEDFQQLAQRALQSTQDPALGLALGARLPTQALQAVGYLLSSAPSMRHAYADAQRHAALLAKNPCWAMHEEHDRARFEFHCLAPHPGTHRMANDWSLSLAYRVVRAFVPSASAHDVALGFAHPAPDDRAPYRLFGAAVRFGQQHNTITFPRAWLDRILPHGDATPYAGVRSLAERPLVNVNTQRRLCDELRLMLRQETRLAHLDVPALARRLGVSQSVLRRRLAAEGVSASQLMDEARCRVACAELSRVHRPVRHLAGELGYADPRSFHRAFKRWTGKTPADYRASGA